VVMDENVDIIAAAYHEAGHACVIDYFGFPVRSVTVLARYAEDGLSGRTRLQMPYAATPLQRAVCALAGPVAEVLLAGGDLRHASLDFKRARMELDGRQLDFAKGVTTSLVLEHEERIADVAHALVKQLIDIREPLHSRDCARLDERDLFRLLRG
jgi:hypothetical protein